MAAANNMLFSQNPTNSGGSSTSANLPLNLETANANAANQLALLQSFTSEMTIPSLYHQAQQSQQSQPQQSMTPGLQTVKNEINNNGDEQMTGGNQ